MSERKTLGQLMGRESDRSSATAAAAAMAPQMTVEERNSGEGVPFRRDFSVGVLELLNSFTFNQINSATTSAGFSPVFLPPEAFAQPAIDVRSHPTEGGFGKFISSRGHVPGDIDPTTHFNHGGDPKALSGGFFDSQRIALFKMHSQNSNLLSILPGSGTGNLLEGQRESLSPEAPPENTDPNDPASIKFAIHEVLKASNRFSPSTQTPFISEGQMTQGTWTTNSGIGVYDKDADTFNLGDMRQLAMEMLQGAVGHANAVNVEDLMKALPDNGNFAEAADRLSVLFGDPQLGFGRVSIENLGIRSTEVADRVLGGSENTRSANSILDFLRINDPEFSGSSEKTGIPRNKDSYGTMNSPLEPFDGPTPFGMIFPVIVIAVALVLIVKLFELIFSFIEDEGKFPNHNVPYTLIRGSSRLAPNGIFEKFLDFIGFPTLEYPFADNVNRGIRLFFGLPTELDLADASSWEGLLDALLNIMSGPGYYLVICKQVARDFEQVNEAFDSFKPGFGPSFLTSLITLFEAFMSSVTFRFFVRMAELGNRYAIFKNHRAATSGRRVHSRQVKSFPVMRHDRLYYTRVNDGFRAVPPTALSAHWSILMGSGILGSPMEGIERPMPTPEELSNFDSTTQTLPAIMDDPRNFHLQHKPQFFRNSISRVDSTTSRIPIEVVQHFEREANAEYCPFYIHDLRTNEVVHIPSFITSIDESFSADYNETDGYGRTDPVRVYSKTSRQISLSFKLVAASEPDHELMWYMINRLIAMLYPSRNSGRELIDSTGEITHLQPFSQVPTESPLVRLRLGNVFHSNYSTKAFARMMGFPDKMTTQLKKRLAARDKDLDVIRANLGELIRSAAKVFKDRAWLLIPASSNAFQAGDTSGIEAIMDSGLAEETEDLACAVSLGRLCTITSGVKVRLIAVSDGAEGALASLPVPGSDPPKKPKPITVTTQTRLVGNLEGVKRRSTTVPNPTPDNENNTYTTHNDVAIFSLEFDPVDNLRGTDAIFGQAGVAFAKAAKEAKSTVHVEYNINGLGPAPEFKILPEDIEAAIPVVAQDVLGTSTNEIAANFKKVIDTLAEEDRKLSNLIRNHPMFRAFETTKGKGLAGFITQMSLNYGDSKWDLRSGNVAPQYMEINLSFAPIHDLTPGIDSKGTMIAPTHPVGALHTDPYINPKGEKELDFLTTKQEIINRELFGHSYNINKEGNPLNIEID